MRNKLLAVIVALCGFASLAAIPITSAQAASGAHASAHVASRGSTTATCPSGTSVTAYCTCPSGTDVAAYCTCPKGTDVSAYCTTCPKGTTAGAYCTDCPKGTTAGAYCTDCPSGTTAVGAYCETGTGGVKPEGSPTVYKEHLWCAAHKAYCGPILEFHLKKGINGAPNLKEFKLTCPAGLSFDKPGSKKSPKISIHGYSVKTGKQTLTVVVKGKAGLATILVYLKKHTLYETSALRHELEKGKIKSLKFYVAVKDTKGRTTKLAFFVKPTS